MRYATEVERTKAAVLASHGRTDPWLRRAICSGDVQGVAPELAAYAAKVKSQAWAITDGDIDVLKRAGYTEDAIFEVTGAAALGAALTRLERGLAVLREAGPAPEAGR